MNRLGRVAVLLVMLLASACTGDGEPSPSPTPSATASATGSPPAPPAGTPTEAPPPTAQASPPNCPAVSGGGSGTNVKLVDVRVGSHSGYDRITFEFADPEPPSPANTLPAFTVERVDQVTQDGSGNPVQVSGAALYSVVMQGASGVDLSGEQVVETYTGPREFKPNFPTLLELEHAGDFENVLSWGIGLREARCISAQQLNTPLRLVLDIPR
ncbi:MAG TPA: hypothetical protein VHL54_07070 [Actinomycetota bacterium]|nr:hypothetical protein [Actinomycetota bacterium]